MNRTSRGTFVKLTHEDFVMRLRVESSGCWLYDGYGLFGRNQLAHVYAYRHRHGEIPEELPEGCEIDHLCRVRACCNPAHLEAVAHRVNVLRGESPSARHAHKTHCRRGHKFSPDNVYLTKAGSRICKRCQRERRRKPKE